MSLAKSPAQPLSVPRAAKALGLTPHRIVRETAMGNLTAVLLPGVPMRIDYASIEKYARENGITMADEPAK